MQTPNSMDHHCLIMRAIGPGRRPAELTNRSRFDLILQGRYGYLRGIWPAEDALSCVEQALLTISKAEIPVTIQAKGLSVTGVGLKGAAEGLQAAIMASLDCEGVQSRPAARAMAFDMHPWAPLYEALRETVITRDGDWLVRILAVSRTREISPASEAACWLLHHTPDRMRSYGTLEALLDQLGRMDLDRTSIRLVAQGMILDATGPEDLRELIAEETGDGLLPLHQTLVSHPPL